MWFDTPSSSSEPVPASAHHRSWRADRGRGLVLGRRIAGARGRGRPRRGVRAQARPAGAGAEDDEQRVADGPAERLRARRRPRLEHERVADERQHRREVRQREQPVRARPGPRAREPHLHQRAGRRQQEIRQADRRRQHAEDQPRRVLAADGLPLRARDDRQHCKRDGEQHRVQLHLPPRLEPAHDEIAVAIAGEQRSLEEHEARRPDRRGSAEPREDLLRHHRLHEKQQERADEDGDGVEKHRSGHRLDEGGRRAKGPAHSTGMDIDRGA